LCVSQHINRLNTEFAEVNGAKIHFNARNETYHTSRKSDLIFLKKMITEAHNSPELTIDTTGYIEYFRNNQLILTAYFSSRNTGGKSTTGAIVFKIGSKTIKSLLNYGSGMLIDDKFYRLK
jgi:hypothetical protein